jgi:PAS domain S-box-containing protein
MSDSNAHEELLRAIAGLAPPAAASFDAAFLRAAAASMPVFLSVITPDPEHRFLWVNSTVPGLVLADVVGRSMFDFVPPADWPETRAALQRTVASGQPDRYVGYGPGRRGPRSRYENWIAPISSGGRVLAIASVTRDVSEEWAIHDRLLDREQRLSLALQAAGMGMWRFDMETRTVELDAPARAIYGATEEALPSATFTGRHIHPDDRAQVDALARVAMSEGRTYRAENRVVRSDGATRWVAVTGAPVRDEHGKVVALLGTVTDITERRELEARARETQKLEALGQLTAGVAHNFNNMLAAILPALEIVEPEVSPQSVSLVQGATEAAQRAAQLVRDLVTFAGRNRHHERREEEPQAVVDRTLRLCRPTFERGIRLSVEVEPGLPSVLVDSGQIEQALLNILINARDAVRERGSQVTVRARLEVDTGDPATRWVAISVEDDGPGMVDAVRERVFDPFFTTKEVGRGTGLGLSTAYAIVREHGGSIHCESAPGRGACFTVRLPASSAAGGASPEAAPARKGMVLVVDDEPTVRAVVRRVLEDAGYSVLEASGRVQAADALSRGAGVDVILLDMDLVGSGRRAMLEQLRALRPTAALVAFGGRDEAPGMDRVDAWLPKPAAPTAIVDMVAKAKAKPAR